MSLETIRIYHSWPVINGFAQVPNNLPKDKTRVSIAEALTYTNGEEIFLSLGSGNNTGSKFGAQSFIRLPARDTNGNAYVVGITDQGLDSPPATDPVIEVIGY